MTGRKTVEIDTSFSDPLQEAVDDDPVCVLLAGDIGTLVLALIPGIGFIRQNELFKQKRGNNPQTLVGRFPS